MSDKTVGEVADELQVTPATIRNWIKKGYISAMVLPSGHHRIPEPELTRLLTEYFQFAPPVTGDDWEAPHPPRIVPSKSVGPDEEWGP